jgi:hypothetical protein
MLQPQPASPKKGTTWIWVVVVTVLVLSLCCLILAIGAGAFAVWKGYITIPGTNLPALKSPVIPTPNLPKGAPKAAPTRITVEPYQPQAGDRYPVLQELVPNWQDPAAPGSQAYDITVNANQPVLVSSGWCTTTKAVLDQNFQHIKYIFEVNGQSVNTSDLAQGSQSALGKTCKDFTGIIRAWPSGKHTIKITMRLDAKINDGWNDYAAGDYTEIYNIIVKP